MKRRTVLVGLAGFITGVSTAKLGPITIERTSPETESEHENTHLGAITRIDTITSETVGSESPALSVEWMRGGRDNSLPDRPHHFPVAPNSRYTARDVFSLNIDGGESAAPGVAHLRVQPTPGTTGRAITDDGRLDPAILDVRVTNVRVMDPDEPAAWSLLDASVVEHSLEIPTSARLAVGITLDTRGLSVSATEPLLSGGLRFVLEVRSD